MCREVKNKCCLHPIRCWTWRKIRQKFSWIFSYFFVVVWYANRTWIHQNVMLDRKSCECVFEKGSFHVVINLIMMYHGENSKEEEQMKMKNFRDRAWFPLSLSDLVLYFFCLWMICVYSFSYGNFKNEEWHFFTWNYGFPKGHFFCCYFLYSMFRFYIALQFYFTWI